VTITVDFLDNDNDVIHTGSVDCGATVQQHCTFQLEAPLPSKNDASQQQKEINANTDVIHGHNCIPTVACQGIQHVLVQRYLSCKEPCYAALWGMAILYWKYNMNQKTWHAMNCSE